VSDIHYGYGLFIGRTQGRRIIVHTGNNDGFKALSLWLPENDLAVAILSNEESTDLEPVAARVLARLLF
jgi:CubicO group peptidase (beta-lactamase class C family)